MERERKVRADASQKAIEKSLIQEKNERHFKAETGHIQSILYLAKEAERGNIKEALYWYDKAAQLDNINGMHGIIRLSVKRKDDLILREKANFCQLAISALENDINAKFEMGKALLYGRGTDKNIPKGYTHIEESAIGGNTEAMLFMGDWCLDKENPDYSAESSVDWYYMAAEKNDLDGKIKLGMSYLNGVGIAPNHDEAVYLFEAAAEKNSAEAMFRAGEAWIDHGEHGNSIAYIWLFLAANFGYSEANQLRDNVSSKLGVDAVVGLQALTKPIMTKLTQKAVTKHSVIKVLNKLYKRKIPIPQNIKGLTEEENINVLKGKENDAELSEQMNPEHNKKYSSEQHLEAHIQSQDVNNNITNQSSKIQNIGKDLPPQSSDASSDFSQTNWNNKN